MPFDELISEYLRGPQLLRDAIQGMTPAQLDAAPVPGKWSTRQLICHIADFEPIYADRMKRIVAEEKPKMMSGDPDQFAAKLAYPTRDLNVELELIDVCRKHVALILKALPEEAFQRAGIHSADGEITLETLLRRITRHIPHHAQFIAEKRKALGVA